MEKFIFTFGSDQLPEYKGNPMKVMLVVEAPTETTAREIVMATSIGTQFCTSYKYEDMAGEFELKYGMEEITLEELFPKEVVDSVTIEIIVETTYCSVEIQQLSTDEYAIVVDEKEVGRIQAPSEGIELIQDIIELIRKDVTCHIS